MKFDLVIPLASQGSVWQNNNELRYCLRSFETHFPIGDVCIVGDHFPDWLTNVIRIDHGDSFEHNKDANIIKKLLAASKVLTGKTFIWSCDDHIVLRKPLKREIVPLYSGDTANYPSTFFTGTWRTALKTTMDFLESNQLPTLNYDTHTPQPVNADQFLEHLTDFPLRDFHRFTVNSLFYNMAGIMKTAHIGMLKATIEKPINSIPDVRRAIKNKLYLGYNNNGLTPELRSIIAELFPDKSSFEL